jgi:hypothetical protein
LKRKRQVKILVGVLAAALLILFLISGLTRYWVRKKIETALIQNSSDYSVTIDKIKISFILTTIDLEGLLIQTKKDHSEALDIKGEIGSIKIKGIKPGKAIFKKEADIRNLSVSEVNLKGRLSSLRDSIIALVIPINVRIGIVHLDRINLSFENIDNAASFSVHDGGLKLYQVFIVQHDTLSADAVKQFDFTAQEFAWTSADSMYAYRNTGILYNSATNRLLIDSSDFHPNYADYDFTSRFKYQKNRIEAGFINISFHDFDIKKYLGSGNLGSSFVKVSNMNMKIFRDNRKEFNHTIKPEFQDMIYNYRSYIKIDSIALLEGDVTYTEHTAEANEPGHLSFNNINARIYNITNDTIYRTDTAYLKVKADALFMGKGKINVLLNARIFDSKNTFSIKGTLAAMQADELNPILEKKAFIYVTSGEIQGMNFSFVADTKKSDGTMTILYQGLDMAVKNKRTDDTIAIKERFISILVNFKVKNSNPLHGKDVRVGIISFERDPERFLINYCVKSLMTGIRSSL